MIVLSWIFRNGHEWSKAFDSVEQAENHVYKLDLIKNWSIDRVWIDSPTQQIWIKEKAQNDTN
jgi:hypothetical protein